MQTKTRSEIVEMLREYWETRPRWETRTQTAERIGTHANVVAAILKGTRADIGTRIPQFFGYRLADDPLYILIAKKEKNKR